MLTDIETYAKEGPTAEEAALFYALFTERAGDRLKAGSAFLDYGVKYKESPVARDVAGQAVDRAVFLAIELNKQQPDDKDVKNLYERALGTAVGEPFRRKPLYFFYADWLRRSGRPKDAIPFYRAVPKGDPNEFNARFFALLLMNGELEDPKLAGPARAEVEKNEAALIDEVRTLAQTAKQTDTTRLRLRWPNDPAHLAGPPAVTLYRAGPGWRPRSGAAPGSAAIRDSLAWSLRWCWRHQPSAHAGLRNSNP